MDNETTLDAAHLFGFETGLEPEHAQKSARAAATEETLSQSLRQANIRAA